MTEKLLNNPLPWKMLVGVLGIIEKDVKVSEKIERNIFKSWSWCCVIFGGGEQEYKRQRLRVLRQLTPKVISGTKNLRRGTNCPESIIGQNKWQRITKTLTPQCWNWKNIELFLIFFQNRT